jgi:hypothetical protein
MATRKTTTLPLDCLPFCGNCHYYLEHKEGGKGRCFAAPPAVIVIADEPYSIRPDVNTTDPACKCYQRKAH